MFKFKFADIGEGLHEGTVGEIYVKKGDKVKEGDSLFQVETDKVNSDIPSPTSGTIADILIKTGETVHVGDEIFHIDDGSAGDSASQEEKKEETKEESASEGGASVVGSIEVSNKLFSFDAFKKPQKAAPAAAKPAPSPAPAKAAAPSASGIKLPDPAKVNPVGNGEKVDVVVIGTGPGGYEVASRLANQNLKVVAVEDRFAGGVCLNIGCIPTKTLLKGAKVLYYMEHSHEVGIKSDMTNVKIQWNKMLERKNKVASTLSKGVEWRIKSAKAEFVKGKAEVVDRYNVKVGKRTFTTKYIVVASGSRPILLNKLPGFEKAYKDGIAVTSTEALEFPKIPKELVIVGGGVIGVEFAALFNRLGSKVTILEGLDSILGPMDGEVKVTAKKLMEDDGVTIKTGVKVVAMEGKEVIYEENGKKGKVKADKVLVSVGRIPNNLELDKKVGIKLGQRGEIEVNDIMQTNVDNIFAIGDVVGHAMLAHTAYKHASVVEQAFKGRNVPYVRDRIPGVVYIYPEISSIGKTEETLKAEGTKYMVSKWKNTSVGRDLAENDTTGFTKLLIDPKYGTILGAHIINASSSEMIAEVAAVMELEGTVHELAWTTHPHPSASEGIWEAASHAVHNLEKNK